MCWFNGCTGGFAFSFSLFGDWRGAQGVVLMYGMITLPSYDLLSHNLILRLFLDNLKQAFLLDFHYNIFYVICMAQLIALTLNGCISECACIDKLIFW